MGQAPKPWMDDSGRGCRSGAAMVDRSVVWTVEISQGNSRIGIVTTTCWLLLYFVYCLVKVALMTILKNHQLQELALGTNRIWAGGFLRSTGFSWIVVMWYPEPTNLRSKCHRQLRLRSSLWTGHFSSITSNYYYSWETIQVEVWVKWCVVLSWQPG